MLAVVLVFCESCSKFPLVPQLIEWRKESLKRRNKLGLLVGSVVLAVSEACVSHLVIQAFVAGDSLHCM